MKKKKQPTLHYVILQHIKRRIKVSTLCNLGRQMQTSSLFVVCCIGEEHINLLGRKQRRISE